MINGDKNDKWGQKSRCKWTALNAHHTLYIQTKSFTMQNIKGQNKTCPLFVPTFVPC